MNKRILFIQLALLILVAPLLLGTTYIVKEGDVEVGRITDDDGSDEVKYIERKVRKPSSKRTTPVYSEEERQLRIKQRRIEQEKMRERRYPFVSRGNTRERVRNKASDIGARRHFIDSGSFFDKGKHRNNIQRHTHTW